MMKFLEKNIMWLALLGIAIAFTTKGAQSFFKNLFSPTTAVEEELSTSGNTIDETKAKEYADMLYQAMTTITGTDEAKIYSVFARLKNRGDFNMVYNAFGKRQRSNFFGNEGDPLSSSRYDLTYWLNDEFNDDEKLHVLEAYPQLNLF